MKGLAVRWREKKHMKTFIRNMQMTFINSVYLTKNEDKAKEVTQQAFAMLYESFDEMDESYLYASLVHEVKNMTNDIVQNKSTQEEVKEHE